MTLIIAAGNKDFAILGADRRLTSKREQSYEVVDEESTKTTILACYDARVSIAFTGLATWAEGSTEKWILDTFQEALKQDNKIIPTLNFFTLEASRYFNNLNLDQPLLFIFFGYKYDVEPKLACWTISNFKWINSIPQVNESSKFELETYSSNESGIIIKTGADRKISDVSISNIESKLLNANSAEEVQNEIYQAIRVASENDCTIGKQSNCGIIHSDVKQIMKSKYYSAKDIDIWYTANVILGCPKNPMIMSGGVGQNLSLLPPPFNKLPMRTEYSFPADFPSGNVLIVECNR